MLTSQQIEMLMKLPRLIDESRKEDWYTLNERGTIGQRYSRHIIDKYLGDEKYVKQKFEALTHLSKDSYYKLIGEGKEGGVEEATLIYVAFGLGITYEEAVLLFFFYGKDLFGCLEISQKIDNVLRKLDSEIIKKANPKERHTIMYDLLKTEELNLLIEKMDRKKENSKKA